jgi:hypothetical protein
MTPPPPAPAPARPRRAWWIVLAVLVVAALGGGLAYGLDGPTPAVTHPPRVAAPSHPTTTSTASTTTTTIAPALTAPTALAALVRDVAAGVDGGTLSSGMGQAITTEAQQAVSDEAAGKPNQAADDLQQVAATIAAGEQNSMIPPSEGALLQGDLSSLANTLGLSAASTPPSTPTTTIPTTTTAPAPAPGPTLGSADIVGPGAGHRHPGAKG